MSQELESRSIGSPRTGTRVSLLVAACFLAVAVYFYTAPTHFTGRSGALFACGSPLSPNRSPLGGDQCHILENGGLHKAVLALALALLVAGLGTVLFGMDKAPKPTGEARSLTPEEPSADVRNPGAEHSRASDAPTNEATTRRAGRPRRLGDEDHEDEDELADGRSMSRRDRREVR